MKMFLKGFGCFVVMFSMSFSPKAGTSAGNNGSQDTDTSIATNEIVIAVAESAPIELINSSPALLKEEKSLPAENTGLKKLITNDNEYGSLHPLAIAFVTKYEAKNEARLEKIITKYSRQMTLIENIMSQYALPAELKYLALIESEMFNGAVSHKGAVGPWQFMATTGRLMGLTINRHRDDRRNLTKSTHAAAKYLKILHEQFNDWLLVIAAYNGGASRVETAIKKSRSRDFWKLQYYLPAESRAHVKKYVAARHILEKQQEEFIPVINMERLILENLNDLRVISIKGKYNGQIIAETLNMDLATFNRYNPGFENEVMVQGYDMRLPKDKVKLFREKRQEILNDSIEMLLKVNNTVFNSNKNNYPEAIALPKTKGIVSTAGQQKTGRK